MTLMTLGLALWWTAHMLGILAPSRRRALAGAIGEGPAKVIAALLIVGSVVLMVVGYRAAQVVDVWYPPAFLTHVNNLLMLVAVFIFIAGRIPSPVRRAIRHPQLIAAKTWAIAHLLVNGDVASIVLFGGILAWSVVAVIGINRRDGPRGELPETAPLGWLAHLGAAAVVFSVIVYVHGILLGVWPFAA